MLTRRQIRVKVMQCFYALLHTRDGSLEAQEKFLKQSIAQTYTLYLLMLGLLREMHQMAVAQLELGERKYLKPSEDDRPDPRRLAENAVLASLSANTALTEALEKRKLRQWYLHEEYVKNIFRQVLESPEYAAYCAGESSWAADRQFVVGIYRDIVAPNDKIYDFLEDEGITWVDDIPLVNTFIAKRLAKLGEQSPESYLLPPLLKNKEDMDFALELLRKTMVHSGALDQEIEGKTPNWDKERIAEIDGILLKMGIAELLYFPSIPERVTINEYLEIAKEYSTPKSSVFINGILDKLIRDFRESGKLKKTGRGLL